MRILLFILLFASRPLAADPQDYVPIAQAIDERDWENAYALALSQGEVAHTLVTWNRLRAEGGAAEFPDYIQFLAANPHWPGLETIRTQAELSIPQNYDPHEIVDFFDPDIPLTGVGAVRLGHALQQLGQNDAAESMLLETWLTRSLDEDGQVAMIAAFADILAPHHATRADAMLWRWQTEQIASMLDLLSEDQKMLATARIALITGNQAAASLIGQVPPALQDHTGLIYDRFNRFASSGNYTDATALLQQQSTNADTLEHPFRWASWRATLARWAMREGRPEQAYQLANTHFLEPVGRDARFFADLEWLSGYLSLRHLDQPEQALQHFKTMAQAVSGPISTSRAEYWIGMAEDALGNEEAATAAFLRAAQHQTAFYGLLASDRLGLTLDPRLTGMENFPDWQQAQFLRGDLGQALQMLIAAEERGAAFQFTSRLARSLDRNGLGQLGTMLTDLEEPFLTLLVGKIAAGRGIIIPAHYFPVHPLAELDLPVSPELALSVARRESEFNFSIGSPVGALGLMQLMPGTAREVSEELGLRYSRARLTSDWPYNAQLGSQYLANLTKTFGQSPVMIAAGYNAGPSRPRTWMTQRGDPRRGEIDVVDWIEMIPFRETRNYVMRVTESIPIYQARLTGTANPVRFRALLNGAPPMLRPQARPRQ